MFLGFCICGFILGNSTFRVGFGFVVSVLLHVVVVLFSAWFMLVA